MPRRQLIHTWRISNTMRTLETIFHSIKFTIMKPSMMIKWKRITASSVLLEPISKLLIHKIKMYFNNSIQGTNLLATITSKQIISSIILVSNHSTTLTFRSKRILNSILWTQSLRNVLLHQITLEWMGLSNRIQILLKITKEISVASHIKIIIWILIKESTII